MPAWVSPDLLTALGLFGALVSAAGYALTSIDKGFLWLASLGFFINWFGDSLDGTLARHRKIERPVYGFFVDHSIDTASATIMALSLGLSPYVRFEIAALTVIGYLLLANLVFLMTHTTGEFRISFAGIGPTEVRVLFVAANTLVFFAGNPSFSILGTSLSIYDLVASSLSVVMFTAFVVTAVIQARILAKKERQ